MMIKNLIQRGGGKKDPSEQSSISFDNTQVTLVVALILMVVVFSILSPVFFSVKNFLNIGIYSSIMGIMATGLTVAMLLGGLDISQYSIAALSGIITAVLVVSGLPVVLIFIIVIATGLLSGGINGLIITKMKINPIITTLGTSLIFRALAFITTNGKYVPFENKLLHFIGRGKFIGIPNAIWAVLIIYGIFAYMLKYTAFGRKIYAVGGNADASFLSGINVVRVRLFAFMISGLMASIGGLLMASQVGTAIPTAGQGSELDVIVAVILGGISLSGGKGKILGTLLGVLILGLLRNGMTLLSIQAYYQMLIRGAVLILAVFLDTLRGGGYK